MQVEVTYSEPGQRETFKVSGHKLIFGRSLNANVTIKREEMSRYHFQIEIESDQFFITDLKSANGVFVNGERLPPEVRLPYNPVFPIEIADRISILFKEEPSLSFAMAENPSSPLSKKPQGKSLYSRSSRSHSERPVIKGETSKKNFLSSQLFLPVLVMALIPLYLIYWEKPESIREEVSSPEVLESPEEAKTTSPSSSAGVTSIPFLDLMGKADCTTDDLCVRLGLKNPREGVSFYERKLILFVNLDFIPNDETHPIFKDLSPREKAEYFLAQLGTQNAIQEIMSSRSLEEVIAIGFKSTSAGPELQFRLNINSSALPSLDQGIHQNIFQEIYFKGNSNLYQNYIANFVDLIVLN